mgnify:FL=1
MTYYGWLTEGSAFAKKPLLGKMSRDYVLEALKGVEILEKPEQLSGKRADLVIVLREDLPCITLEDCNGLMSRAKEQPQLFRDEETDELLAMSMNGELAAQLTGGDASLPNLPELEKRLEKAGVFAAEWPTKEEKENGDFPFFVFPLHSAGQFSAAYNELNMRNIARHEENGVIFLDHDRTIVESDVVIAPGVMIYPGNTLQGSTRIGADCVLYPNNRLNNAVVGRGTTVESSVLLNCAVGEETTVGPYAYLRPDTSVGNHCRIGDFVEIKNSSIGDGTKVSHLTYVGDSDLGKDINLGCGVVFVNYDGKVKNRSKVEDHAFIGCNCNLVAPVHVGKNAYLAAGSTVVEDVPEDALFVARSRGVVKEDWVKRRKEAGKL